MADETMKATHGFLSVIRGNAELINPLSCIESFLLSVGSSTAKAGHIVTTVGEAENAVDLAVTTDEHALGIILGPTVPGDDYDIDDVITDGTEVDVLKFGTCPGVLVAVFLAAKAGPVAIVNGNRLVIGAEAGKVAKYVYADAASETDTLEEWVGDATEIDAGSTADDHVIVMRMR